MINSAVTLQSRPVYQVGVTAAILLAYHLWLSRMVVREVEVIDKWGLFLFICSTVLLCTPALEVVSL